MIIQQNTRHVNYRVLGEIPQNLDFLPKHAILKNNANVYQIKKWISIINFNNDNQISKEEYLNSIRGFYTLNQLSKFAQ